MNPVSFFRSLQARWISAMESQRRSYSSARKLVVYTLLVPFFATGYLLTNQYLASKSIAYDLSLPFESTLPFIPYLIFGYVLVFLNISIGYLAVNRNDLIVRGAFGILFLSLIGFTIFLFFPVRMLYRPELNIIPETVTDSFVSFFFWLDKPVNCFPSEHVAMSVFSAFLAWKVSRPWGVLMFVFAFLVAVSVVLVRQHYIVDVLAGALLAWLAYRLFLKSA